MQYSFECACGRRHFVTPQQAGALLVCDCGQSVTVPKLSRLRVEAGESRVPLDIIGRINAQIRSGELPAGKVCPLSGRPADAIVEIHVQCEEIRVRGGRISEAAHIVVLALFGWLGLLMAALSGGERVEHGRDTSVVVPLRVSSSVVEQLRRQRSQRKLKRLLRSVPIYDELLRNYPLARVWTRTPIGS